MIDTRTVLEVIEAADHREPFCTCGAPTHVVARGRHLWLSCSTLADGDGRPKGGLLARLAQSRHTDRLLVDLAA
jgi:hypothetical protein